MVANTYAQESSMSVANDQEPYMQPFFPFTLGSIKPGMVIPTMCF